MSQAVAKRGKVGSTEKKIIGCAKSLVGVQKKVARKKNKIRMAMKNGGY